MAKVKTISVSIPAPLVERITEEAKREGLSRSKYIALLLMDHFSLTPQERLEMSSLGKNNPRTL
jgi:metal-responsive CopG/Arc/MetJ family transcriptional regulator